MRWFITVILALGIVGMVGCRQYLIPPHYTQVKIAAATIQARIVSSAAEQTRGLMGVKNLNADQGMLFIYPSPQPVHFWMRGMVIPLDIIWINQNKKIIGVSEHLPICQKDPCPIYSPGQPVQYVLEVNAGFVAAHHLTIGMPVTIALSS